MVSLAAQEPVPEVPRDHPSDPPMNEDGPVSIPHRGLLAAGLAAAVAGSVGVFSIVSASADEVASAAPPAAAPAVADDKPQPPPYLPWGEKPAPVKKGEPGAPSAALAATGADIAPATTQASTVPVAEFGPKGWTNKRKSLRNSRTTAAPKPPSVGARAEPVSTKASTVYYHYATGYQYAVADGISANLSISKPYLADGDFHTLAELAVQSADGYQKVEVGWVVSRNINGDLDPHLFVYHWVDNKETCWNSCGWTQISKDVVPGYTLPTGVTKKFGIQQFDGAWWIAYDSVWIGYFDNKLWEDKYAKGGLVQWFGEVASAEWQKPCTDMGNGLPPTDTTAARFNSMSLINGPKLQYTQESKSPPDPEDPDAKPQPPVYATEYVTDRGFRFGGPGRC